MQTIRIGNDIALEWEIIRNGVPEDFRGKSLSLFICHRYGRERVSSFTIEGSRLRFAFLGKQQRYVGDYSLLLIVNDGCDGMFSVDLDRAFRLTQHTDCGCDGGGIKLDSDIAAPANGLSAYELAVINGYEGSEQEWLESIVQPAKDAAGEALAAAVRADSATATAMATNTAVQQAESQRDAAESVRTAAESGRQTAEAKRQQDTAAAIKKAETATMAANEAALKADTAAENAVLKIAQELTPEEKTHVQTNVGVKDTIDVVGVGEVRFIDVNAYKEGNGYWNKSGVIAESSSTNYFHTKPIPVSQGDIILLKDSFATAAVMPVVKVQSDNTFISVIASGDSSMSNYSAIAQAGYISLSVSNNNASRMQVLIIPCRLASLLAEPAGGYLADLYKAGGAVYNEDKGLWTLNGVDLTDEEIAVAYNDSIGLRSNNITEACIYSNMRTNFPGIRQGGYSRLISVGCFSGCRQIEVVRLANSFVTVNYFSSISYMFQNCKKLVLIDGIIDVVSCSDENSLRKPFGGCSVLENVKLRNLKINLSFSDSPLLNNESILYLITNAENKSITITLHPEAYDRAMSDSSITAALAAKPLITIAK